jgi:hypothetical protein
MRATIDLGSLPVADNHCSAFPPTARVLGKEQFMRLFALGGPLVFGSKAVITPEEMSEQVQSSLAFKYAVKLLSEFLETEKEIDSVTEARNNKSKDFPHYLNELFRDVGLQILVIDSGFQPVTLDEFKSYVPTKVGRTFRLEPFVKQLLETEPDFGGLLRKFDETLVSEIKEGCAGFKTVIAYRTGLDVNRVTENLARADFEHARNGLEPRAWFGPVVKNLRDHLIGRTIDICIKHNRVLQIHTGLGDTDIVGSKCNPILLQNFLKQDEVQNAKVVLIHGGWPYVIEASWLANVLPNVYLELSTSLPPYFAPAVAVRRYIETIQQTPSRKIVYGSDAGELPEIHWLSARVAKSTLQATLEQLVGQGMLDEDDAFEMAEQILYGNVKRLYSFE